MQSSNLFRDPKKGKQCYAAVYYFRQMHPKLNQTKASLSVGCVPAAGKLFCMPAEQERRDISQIAQNALHKIEQLFRKKSCYSACAHV